MITNYKSSIFFSPKKHPWLGDMVWVNYVVRFGKKYRESEKLKLVFHDLNDRYIKFKL